MRNLGFDKYFVQGGDVGSYLCKIMADSYDSVVGLHCELRIRKEMFWERTEGTDECSEYVGYDRSAGKGKTG
jgi:hypothetical protein